MRFWLRFPLMDAAGDGSGGGGGGGDAFDPAKFKTELMGEVTKMLNGGIGRLEKTIAGLKPPPDPPKPGDGGDDGQGGGDKGDPKVKGLEKRLADLTAKLEASDKARAETEAKARETARQAAIRSEVAKHSLNPDAVDDALRFFRDSIRYNDAGELVAGDDEAPLADFVKATVEKKPLWQPPVANGGAGATGGARSNQKPIDLDAIKPGMSAEERARVFAHLNSLAGQL